MDETVKQLEQQIPEADPAVLLEVLQDCGHDTSEAARLLLGSACSRDSSLGSNSVVVITDEDGTASTDEVGHLPKRRRHCQRRFLPGDRTCRSSSSSIVEILDEEPVGDHSWSSERSLAIVPGACRSQTGHAIALGSQLDADMALALALQEEDEQRPRTSVLATSPDVIITRVSLKFCQDLEDSAVQSCSNGADVDALLAQFLQNDEDAAWLAERGKCFDRDRGLAMALSMQEEEKSALAEIARMQAEDARFDGLQVTTLHRIAQLLSLATPHVAKSAGVREALLAHTQDQELQGLRNGEARSLAIREQDPIAHFVSGVRQAMGAPAGEEKNVRLLLMPLHTEALIKKMEALKAAGHPHLPCVAFHSTPHPDARDGIAQGNFDPNKCGRHDAGYYGRGTYFHTNVPQGGAGGRNVFLSLILKGREFALNRHDGCPLQEGYDSHIAADRRNTGETVIFSKDQMLPVFLYDH